MESELPREHVCKDNSETLWTASGSCDLKSKQLCELPDLCLIKIFRYLAPNHLAKVSQVSRKFKLLARKVFKLYFDPGPIQIEYGRNEINSSLKYYFEYRSQYEIPFRSSIRRLMIPLVFPHETGGRYDSLFHFIRRNCCKKLISLELFDNKSELLRPLPKFKIDYKVHGEIAKNQLKHLKYLRVKNVQFEYLYDGLLRYTEHLRGLVVINECERCYGGRRKRYCRHLGVSWTTHIYPDLESICFFTGDKRFDLMPMIRRNPKLRNVVCDSTKTIQSICNSDIKFNSIGMIFAGWRGEFGGLRRLHKDIVKFGRSKNFEKFELNVEGVYDDIFQLVSQIPNLTGLHGDEFIAHASESFQPSIVKICIHYDEYATILAQQIDEKFPNLKELRINARLVPWIDSANERCYFKQIANDILYNADMFKNLEQFHHENDDEVEMTWNDVVDINVIRSKRPNPTKILVYLDPIHFHKFNKNVVELEFIEIKPWVHGSCELCINCDISF